MPDPKDKKPTERRVDVPPDDESLLRRLRDGELDLEGEDLEKIRREADMGPPTPSEG